MSATRGRLNGAAAAAAAARDRSLLQLLDPTDLLPGHTTADLYSLRHLTLRGGLPDSPTWLRAQAWKVLLGYLPPEKKEWSATLSKRRKEYYQFLDDLSPQAGPTTAPGTPTDQTLSDRDVILDQIYKDLARSRKNGFAFYQATPRPSSSCPVAPLPDQIHDVGGEERHEPNAQQSSPSGRHVRRLDSRHRVLHRLALINRDFEQHLRVERMSSMATTKGKRKAREPPLILHLDNIPEGPAVGAGTDLELPIKSPPILLSPPSPGGLSRESSVHSFASAAETAADLSLERHAVDAADNAPADAPLQPPPERETPDIDTMLDRNWHSLLRILYLFALLNPSIGYVQGMNEALFTLLYVFGSATYPAQAVLSSAASTSSDLAAIDHDTTNMSEAGQLRDWNNAADLADLSSHAEADAFWCFSTLIAEMRELYEFDGIARQTPADNITGVAYRHGKTGMAGILCRFSLRLKWLDPDLWRDLRAYHLDPRLPYYSLRWLACLVSTELSLPSVMRIWDALLAEQEQGATSASPSSSKTEFLIDVCCAMLIHVRDQLPRSTDDINEEQEAFSYGMRFLQAYPDDDIGPVLEMATLFRQRRLAADLTGDGPPSIDDMDDADSESNPITGVASVRTRAAQTLRGWASAASAASSPMTVSRSAPGDTMGVSEQLATPAKSSWFGSVGRLRGLSLDPETPDASFSSSTGSAASAASTPSKASLSEMFAKYAEAVQSSDAAANLSKASTNLTAKAMARFGDISNREGGTHPSPGSSFGGRVSSGPVAGSVGSRMTSLGSMSAGIFNRNRRTASASQSFSSSASPFGGRGSPHTPDMTRWSRDTMPDFPLPNVSDSPAGRMEYVDSFGKRISMVNGRQTALPGSPALSEGRFDSAGGAYPLPSMRVAAKLGIYPGRQRETSGSTSPNGSRNGGPKPLLLSRSARPPREGSGGSPQPYQDEPSRKVSSGPLAHSMSRDPSWQDGRGSMAGSASGRSSRSISFTGSQRSSPSGSPDTSMTALQQADKLPPLPSLTGQSAAAALPPQASPASPSPSHSHVMGPVGLQGASAKDGKVPAGAFGRSNKPGAAASDVADQRISRPEFGQISSSSDIPLVQPGSTSISRPRAPNKKRTSGSTVGSQSASTAGSNTGNRLSSRTSLNTSGAEGLGGEGMILAGLEGVAVEESRLVATEPESLLPDECDVNLVAKHLRDSTVTADDQRPVTLRQWSVGDAVQLTDAPMPREPTDPVAAHNDTDGVADASVAIAQMPDTLAKYSLSDEPAFSGADGDEDGTRRDSTGRSSISGSVGGSSGGIIRTKRFTKSRTGSSSTTQQGSGRRSLAALRRSSRTSTGEAADTVAATTQLSELHEDDDVYGGVIITNGQGHENHEDETERNGDTGCNDSDMRASIDLPPFSAPAAPVPPGFDYPHSPTMDDSLDLRLHSPAYSTFDGRHGESELPMRKDVDGVSVPQDARFSRSSQGSYGSMAERYVNLDTYPIRPSSQNGSDAGDVPGSRNLHAANQNNYF
ncbi:RabGAP/TBC [Testicularia cyperi]|uniref:RabGAP/TBC n=1 Tax=Testicularia cyperi TaxID=1882483 RepID=A0A317Y0K1_9BASI|nr:RabGAP/TBC [Testicularia cyperi]